METYENDEPEQCKDRANKYGRIYTIHSKRSASTHWESGVEGRANAAVEREDDADGKEANEGERDRLACAQAEADQGRAEVPGGRGKLVTVSQKESRSVLDDANRIYLDRWACLFQYEAMSQAVHVRSETGTGLRSLFDLCKRVGLVSTEWSGE